jgi:predicted phage terminase large subunit-like protein
MTTLNQQKNGDLFEALSKDRDARRAATRQSHFLFFHFYFAHYVKYETAPFHRELFQLSERDDIRNLFIVAFRGSAKSTIFTTSYPVWAILGEQQRKFVLLLSQTQAQARQHMMNLRRELESNALLKSDLGPFQEENNEWGSSSLVFSKLGARITAVSTEQSIRGLRHNQYRPDLIIGDDLEDIASTKTREGRDKTYQWLTGEVIPAGDRLTRLIIIGNLLHEDSLLMRLKEDVEQNRIDGLFKTYPLVEGQRILWPGKYPNMDTVEEERRKAANEYAFQREYLLKIVPAEDQAIHPEWIQYYDEIPPPVMLFQGQHPSHRETWIGMDLAISEKSTADYTAIVPAVLYEVSDGYRIYILSKIINKRMKFPETVDTCKTLDKTYYDESGGRPTFVVEDVGYQKAMPQMLEEEGLWNVKSFRPGKMDKRMRLNMVSPNIKNGKVLFPRQGAEQLIQQLVHFGVEKHDDLVDAFTSLVLTSMTDPPLAMRILVI